VSAGLGGGGRGSVVRSGRFPLLCLSASSPGGQNYPYSVSQRPGSRAYFLCLYTYDFVPTKLLAVVHHVMPTASKNAGGYTGIAHFLKYMQEGQPEWALFAIEAPIEAVSTAFAEFRSCKRCVVDVPRRGPTDDIDVARLSAVVQTKGNPWTVVFRSLTDIESVHLQRVPEEARMLSARLGTRAVTLFAEGTSCGTSYEIFERGQSLESAAWEADELTSFDSTLRQRPARQQDRDMFVDELFRAEGIYVPCCYPHCEGQDEWLVVEEVSAEAVERADLIDIGEGTDASVSGRSVAARVSPLTIVLYFAFLLWAAWLAFRSFTLGWTASRVVLLSVVMLGFVICRGKWRRPGRTSACDDSRPTKPGDGDER
jgi:hypothetical protein